MNAERDTTKVDAEVIPLDTAYARKQAANDAKMQGFVDEFNAELKEISDAFDGDIIKAEAYYSAQMKSPDKEISSIAHGKWSRCVVANSQSNNPG